MYIAEKQKKRQEEKHRAERLENKLKEQRKSKNKALELIYNRNASSPCNKISTEIRKFRFRCNHLTLF